MNTTTQISATERARLFEGYYSRLYTRVYSFARRFVDNIDAEEIVADSFFKLWKSTVDLTNPGKSHKYLRVCTQNACWNLCKQRKRKIENIEKYSLTLTDVVDDHHATIMKEFTTRLMQEIEKLPPQQRRIFKMSYIDRMSEMDVCEALGIAKATVGSVKVKTMKKIRIAFKDYDFAFILVALSLLNKVR